MGQKNRIETWPAKLGIAVLIIALFPWEYGFYMLSRVFVCAVASYYCIKTHKKSGDQIKDFWYFLGIAILFNPIIPIYLFYRTAWILVDIFVAIYFYKYIKTINK